LAESAAAKDEIDPELVSLPRSRGIRPVLGFSLLGLAVLLAVELRADLVYGLSGETPREIDAQTFASGGASDNEFVSLRGNLDFTAAGRLRGRQSAGSRVTPVLGTDGRGWVHEPAEALATMPREDNRIVGRVRRLDRLAFADELARFRAEQDPIPRIVFPEALRGSLPLTDALGTTLAAPPDARVVAVEQVAGVALVTVIQTEQIFDGAVAERALVAAGILPAGTSPVAADDASWTFEVPAPEGPAAVVEKLRAGKIYGATAVAKVTRHEGTAAQLAVDGSSLSIGGVRVPLGSLERLIYYVRLPDRPAAESWVVLAGDSPEAYWYVKFVYGALGLLAVFVAFSLLRWFRDVTRTTAAAPAKP